MADGDLANSNLACGYSAAQVMEIVLKQCSSNDLSRENIIKQAANLKDVELDLTLRASRSIPARKTTILSSSSR
jgi:branched-chain amino acid transport system substrate-binding protein